MALINSNPNIMIKPPHPHVDSNRPYKCKQNMSEITETYRRVKALKAGYTDNKLPKSFMMRD